MTMDLAKFLNFSVSPAELLIRGTIMYWFLFLLFRFVLRRDTSSAGISDILLLVLLGDAAQNAMIGQGHTVADGMLLIGTLAGWSYTLNYISIRLQVVARLTDPLPILLIQDGKPNPHNLRRQHLTQDELMAQLRLHGLESMRGLKQMYLEGDGSFSVIKTDASSQSDPESGKSNAAMP